MTTVADIFDRLQPGDLEIMHKAYVFSPLTDRLDKALLPFISAYRMHRMLHYYGAFGQDVNKRPMERIRKKLKRAVLRTYPRMSKGCGCEFCLDEFPFIVNGFNNKSNFSGFNYPSSGRLLGRLLWDTKCRLPVQQLPSRGHRFGQSHIKGMKASVTIIDDIVQGVTASTEDFAKTLKGCMDRFEKGDKW